MHKVGRSALTALMLVTTLAIVEANGPMVAVKRADEYHVKAAMLYNFARFIEWPAEAFTAPSTPLNFCILGVDPFGSVLEDELKDRVVGGRPIQVRRISDVEPGCHVAFISGSERKRMSVVVDRLRSAGTLTVSEEEGFGTVGGMIELFTDSDSIKFNIYPSVMEQSKLHASARLIALSANHKGQGGHR